jgi:rSAM/selenodomain-associated transferase 2
MISVVVPTLDAEAGLGQTLAALVPAAVSGLVRQVIVVDGGSSDRTLAITEEAGCTVLTVDGGRGAQLGAGAAAAAQPWLLFLHADTVLESEWERAAATFIEQVESGALSEKAAAFRFALDDTGLAPRLLERLVALRCSALALPYGDQGLLISRRLYEAVGGYPAIPLMEDVALVRKLGRRRLRVLPPRARTSAARYRRDGYLARPLRNLSCLILYYLGVSPMTLVRVYR